MIYGSQIGVRNKGVCNAVVFMEPYLLKPPLLQTPWVKHCFSEELWSID